MILYSYVGILCAKYITWNYIDNQGKEKMASIYMQRWKSVHRWKNRSRQNSIHIILSNLYRFSVIFGSFFFMTLIKTTEKINKYIFYSISTIENFLLECFQHENSCSAQKKKIVNFKCSVRAVCIYFFSIHCNFRLFS